MGVYIDMEMPTACFECKLYNGEYCWCRAVKKEIENLDARRVSSFCPLVEVPEPHGDLIDKNELTYCSYDLDNYFWFRAVPEETVESTKVIIPASKEE